MGRKVVYDFNPAYWLERKERNLKILKEKTEGATYYELAKKYKLHPNRIYQIVKNTKRKLKENPEFYYPKNEIPTNN
jgi:Mor family transcriptional regulator